MDKQSQIKEWSRLYGRQITEEGSFLIRMFAFLLDRVKY